MPRNEGGRGKVAFSLRRLCRRSFCFPLPPFSWLVGYLGKGLVILLFMLYNIFIVCNINKLLNEEGEVGGEGKEFAYGMA